MNKKWNFIQLDNVLESTKEPLAEYAIDELEIFDNNMEKATNKKQDLIDITPH